VLAENKALFFVISASLPAKKLLVMASCGIEPLDNQLPRGDNSLLALVKPTV
jgi:hypothetical protein